MIAVVTSCSAAGWRQYGERFVETFCRYWPAGVSLSVYSEDLREAEIAGVFPWVGHRDVTFYQLLDVSPPCRLFRERATPLARGRERRSGQFWPAKAQAEGYNWRYDACRFCHKVFAIAAAAAQQPGGRLYWVDADVVTFADVPLELLERLLPEGKALSCLDRGGYHSECGFVGYHLDHPAARPFIEAFARLYATDEVLGLPEWHDSWVFDWLRREMKVPSYSIPFPEGARRHPFVNSELGRYMDHLKGPRKDAGRTPHNEVTVDHGHAYWR